MFHKISLFILCFVLLIFTVSAQDGDQAYNALRLDHDGIERMAHVYEPDTEIDGVMIALHSYFSSGRALEAQSGLNAVADERGWVIIYPETVEPYWDDGRTDVDLPYNSGTVDDSGYLSLLADTAREIYATDTIYLTGLAQGGTMVLRAICDYPTAFDGVAIVSATMWSYQATHCADQEALNAVDMIFIKGTEDHIYWNQTRDIGDNPDWTILGVADTYNFWASQFGCGVPEQTSVEESILAFANDCDNDARLAFLPIVNGSNNWSRQGDYALNQVDIDTGQIIGAFLDGDADWEETTIQGNIPEAFARSYITYVPTTYDPTTPTPIVLSLHGRGANNFSQALVSGWNQVAEDNGFIVVYPQAYDPNYNTPQADAVWNYNEGIAMMDVFDQDDDVFLDQIVDDLALDLNVEMSRLYVNGLSNGGYMTHRLGCTRADRYAGFASMAANAPFGLTELCSEGQHAPFLIYHGTADTISPWQGATVEVGAREVYLLAPIPNTIAFWLDQNECDSGYTQRSLPNADPDSRVLHVTYDDCPDDSDVELYAVVGGGHTWHGVRDVTNDFLGEINMDVNASEAIWDFYSQYTLDGRISDVDPVVADDTIVTGTGMPSIPVEDPAPDPFPQNSPQGQIINVMRSGGLVVYFALDLSEPDNCDALDEAELSVYGDIAEAFSELRFVIATVSALNDCRAEAIMEQFSEDASFTRSLEADDMTDALVSVPSVLSVNLVIGSAKQITELIGQEVSGGQSVLLQPNGVSARPLAVVPPEGWIELTSG